MMMIYTPHLTSKEFVTQESVRRVLELIRSKDIDQFAILAESDEMSYLQTLVTENGYLLDYQEGSLDKHYTSIREDLSIEQVQDAFIRYAEHNPAWQSSIEFYRTEVARPSSRLVMWFHDSVRNILRFIFK